MQHRHLAGLALLTLFFVPLSAQFKAGMKALEDRDYAAAHAAFERRDADPITDQQLRYGLALTLSKNRYEKYDPLRAYGLLDSLLIEREAMAEDDREKWDKRLSERDVGRAISAIESRALRDIGEEAGPEVYEQYLTTYRRLKERRRREVREKRNAVALAMALDTLAYDSSLDLVNRYALYETDAAQNGLADSLLHRFLRQKGWGEYDQFTRENAASPYVKAGLKAQTDELIQGADVDAALTFMQAHRSDPFGLRVYNAMGEIGRRSTDRKALLKWLNTFSSESKDWSDLYRQFLVMTVSESDEQAIAAAWQLGREKLGREGTDAVLQALEKELLTYLTENDPPVDLRERLLPYADPGNKHPEIWRPLADHYVKRGGPLAGPVAFIDKYPEAPVVPELQRRYAEAQARRLGRIEALRGSSEIFALEGTVNSGRAEYFASESTDGRTLYFTRGLGSEDIFLSRQGLDGEWQPAIPLASLNTSANESLLNVSADGTEMLLFKNGKIFNARKTAKGWQLGDRLPDHINASGWQSDTWISADNKRLFFSRRRSESIDIMMSERDEEGNWGEPMALNDLNTDYEDRCPVLATDLKTLYFSSMRPGGLGDGDIYVSTRLDDTWQSWSEPENLGEWINTSGREWDFKITPDGERAYFSRIVNGQEDLYSVYLPEARRPAPVIIIEGNVVTRRGEGVGTVIQWINLETNAPIQETRSDPANGDFVASLPALNQGRVGYIINQAGFFPVSGSVEVGSEQRRIVLEAPLEIIANEEVKAGELNLTIGNVFFATGSAELDPASSNGLDRIAAYLLENSLCVEIAGHTDNVGAPDQNQKLSNDRASSVRRYLLDKGMDADCLSARGYGESQPIADNEKAGGRLRNRRVEIRIR